MKLYIKWRYPDENETHEHTYHDIKADSIRIHYGMLWFASHANPEGWIYQLTHIVEMKVEEED